LRDHVDAFGVIPAPRDRDGEIGFVLVVGGDELNLLTQHLTAEILDRHLGGFHRIFAAVIGIDARLVVQDADLDLPRGRLGGRHRSRCKNRQKSKLHVRLPAIYKMDDIEEQFGFEGPLPAPFRPPKAWRENGLVSKAVWASFSTCGLPPSARLRTTM